MNKKSLFCLLVFSLYAVSSYTAGQSEARLIDPERVAQKKAELSRELYYNKLERYAVMASFVVGLGAIGYKITHPTPPQIANQHVCPVELPKGKAAKEVSVNAQDMHLIKEHLKAVGLKVGALEDSSLSWFGRTWRWFKSASAGMGNQVLAMTIFSVVNNGLGPVSRILHYLDGAGVAFAHKLFHEGDLDWFTSTHVHINQVMHNLLMHASLLEHRAFEGKDGKVIEPQDPDQHLNAVYNNWNILVDQSEHLLAYLEYSADQSSTDLLFILEEISRIKAMLTASINSAATEFDALIADKKIFERMEALKVVIDQLLREYEGNQILLG